MFLITLMPVLQGVLLAAHGGPVAELAAGLHCGMPHPHCRNAGHLPAQHAVTVPNGTLADGGENCMRMPMASEPAVLSCFDAAHRISITGISLT